MGLMDKVDATCLDLYHVGNWMVGTSGNLVWLPELPEL